MEIMTQSFIHSLFDSLIDFGTLIKPRAYHAFYVICNVHSSLSKEKRTNKNKA